jgi:hypothetical protein
VIPQSEDSLFPEAASGGRQSPEAERFGGPSEGRRVDGVDPIVEEIRAIRRALAAKFDNDLSAIMADIRRREAADGRTYVSLPRRRWPTEEEVCRANEDPVRVPFDESTTAE